MIYPLDELCHLLEHSKLSFWTFCCLIFEFYANWYVNEVVTGIRFIEPAKLPAELFNDPLKEARLLFLGVRGPINERTGRIWLIARISISGTPLASVTGCTLVAWTLQWVQRSDGNYLMISSLWGIFFTVCWLRKWLMGLEFSFQSGTLGQWNANPSNWELERGTETSQKCTWRLGAAFFGIAAKKGERVVFFLFGGLQFCWAHLTISTQTVDALMMARG